MVSNEASHPLLFKVFPGLPKPLITHMWHEIPCKHLFIFLYVLEMVNDLKSQIKPCSSLCPMAGTALDTYVPSRYLRTEWEKTRNISLSYVAHYCYCAWLCTLLCFCHLKDMFFKVGLSFFKNILTTSLVRCPSGQPTLHTWLRKARPSTLTLLGQSGTATPDLTPLSALNLTQTLTWSKGFREVKMSVTHKNRKTLP